MYIQASCHCGAVHFSFESRAPHPFMVCYCSICRKTAGGGGYAINLHGDARTLKVEGEADISVYRGYLDFPTRQERSPGERRFCRQCGSALWVWDPRWPELVHPFASAVDTSLPAPPARTHIMLNYKPDWVTADIGPKDQHFPEYPEESLEEWHRRHGVWEE